ncbi:MAG: 30S ribosomal protein S8 [Clostridiales bacterium]|nr:30S ribosomal protein S8 [Clostridiales bacterium]
MITTDPIADMLTRMRNALSAKHQNVSIPVSKTKVAIAELLLKEGYIASYKVEGEGIKSNIVIDFKDNGVIKGLRRISKPGLRIYAGVEDLPRVINGLGIAIISTNKGIITDREARKLGVGGEVLAYVW